MVLVSDVTYIKVGENFMCLSLVSDYFSKDIVGWNLGEDNNTDECIEALKMVKRKIPKNLEIIHHSDRGSTYANHKYKNLLNSYGWKQSMTEVLHCYENSVAERINGILKQEYYLDLNLMNKKHALKVRLFL